MNKIVAVCASLMLLGSTGCAHAGCHGNWVGPFVGGAVVGSMLGAAARPVYVATPVYVQPQPVCWQSLARYDRWGRPFYQTMCR